MPPTRPHKVPKIFTLSKALVIACYELTQHLPPEEKTVLTQYIRSSALKAHIKIAQAGHVKKIKKERKLFKGAQKTLVVLNTAVEVMIEVGLAKKNDARKVLQLSSICYKKLTKLKKKTG